MSDRKSKLEELISSLKQTRDELALQMHLGKAEVRQQWEEAQVQLKKLMDEYDPLKDVASETAENVLSGLELTATEVKRGFDRVAKLVKEKLSEEDSTKE